MITPQAILDEWDSDAPIDEQALDTESLRVPQLHAKYMRILTGIKGAIRKRKSKLESLTAHKKRWVSGVMTQKEMDDRGWDYDPLKGAKKPLKGELDDFVKVDPDVQKLRDEIEDFKICQELVLDIVNSINWRHTQIRNAIDWARFSAGG